MARKSPIWVVMRCCGEYDSIEEEAVCAFLRSQSASRYVRRENSKRDKSDWYYYRVVIPYSSPGA